MGYGNVTRKLENDTVSRKFKIQCLHRKRKLSKPQRSQNPHTVCGFKPGRGRCVFQERELNTGVFKSFYLLCGQNSRHPKTDE